MVEAQTFRLSRLKEPEFAHWKLLIFWPLFGAFFYIIEWVAPREGFHVMWCPLDDAIPFQESFLIPYVYWYILMVGAHAYTFFADAGAFRRLMYNIILTFGVSSVVFLVYPTCQELRPDSFERDNLLTRFMGWFYVNLDTSTNVCPSLHVCGSIAAAQALCDTERFRSRGWKAIHYGSAALICISTVFLKQHSVIDVVWGLVLSAVSWWLVYRMDPDRLAVKFKRN